jgi:hypothetical protein
LLVSRKKSDKRAEHENEELDAEQVVEDAVEFFGADHEGAPASDADAPVPPG